MEYLSLKGVTTVDFRSCLLNLSFDLDGHVGKNIKKSINRNINYVNKAIKIGIRNEPFKNGCRKELKLC